jgi:uroporphyrinogen decarboxylase
MGLFDQSSSSSKLPVWFMRQAGRYHQHYQKLRSEYGFMQLCKQPELAYKVTMGPIEEFDFDAAILFSDLLFPLEQMGLGLSYAKGPPSLEKSLQTLKDIQQIKMLAPAKEFYTFQQKALSLIRGELSPQKTLIGFAGAPWTLFAYAVEGKHAGSLVQSKLGLYDGRFEAFCEILLPELIESLKMQIQGGADCLCLFDTAAGELSFQDYQKYLLNWKKPIFCELKKFSPKTKLISFTKHTHEHYFEDLDPEWLDVIALDWRHDLAGIIKRKSKQFYIQGNLDPVWIHLPWEKLKLNLDHYFSNLQAQGVDLSRWIFGLGHGVLPQTPETNVKKNR